VETRRTNFIGEPIILDVVGVPNLLREVRCSLINIDKLDKFGIEMWVTERTVGHKRVIEMLRLVRVCFQSVELCKLGLRSVCEKHE
jgi:hypothetical protein